MPTYLWKRRPNGTYELTADGNIVANVVPANRWGSKADRVWLWTAWVGAEVPSGWEYLLRKAKLRAEAAERLTEREAR